METRTNTSNKNGISEKTLKIITVIQAAMLAGYGIFAIALYGQMHTYDITSVSSGGGMVHTCYMATVLMGAFLIIYRLVKERKVKGFAGRPGFLVPVITTASAFIFSQANTVYTSTSGGSAMGFIRYLLSAGLSGNDPIDSFVYGSLTVPKYILVTIIGIACAAFTLLRSEGKAPAVAALPNAADGRTMTEAAGETAVPAPAGETAMPAADTVRESALADALRDGAVTDALREKAMTASAAGKAYLNRAAAIAGAAAAAAKEAAREYSAEKPASDTESAADTEGAADWKPSADTERSADQI